MSSIITKILSSTVGLLWNKAVDSTASNLKDGDVTDVKIRQVIVRELTDIKTKLDGISRKDLLSSYCFLKEGVDLLNDSLDKSKLDHQAGSNETCDELEILNEALELPEAMKKIKIKSKKEFESATMRFRNARIKATEAFSNEALDIDDRIFAAKLRIVSEILECLESPETAVTGCLSFLQNLHTLPAIREIFSAYLDGGFLALFNKEEREENVKSVMLINYVMFHFNFKFTRKFTNKLRWPGAAIELEDRSFNPILEWQEVSTKMRWGDELAHISKELTFEELVNPYLSAVNSHGEVLGVLRFHNEAEMVSYSLNTKSEPVELPEQKDGGDEVFEKSGIKGLAVDKNNNFYIVRWVKTRTIKGEVKSGMLFVLDKDYNIIHSTTLGFLDGTKIHVASDWVNIAVNKNNDIVMMKVDDPNVYVCDNTGRLKYKFQHDADSLRDLAITNQNEIVISSYDMAVSVYTEKGNLKSTIKLPEGNRPYGVTFHHVIYKIIVLTYIKEEDSFFLLCYSETGELESSTFFCNLSDANGRAYITSHPNGPVAVVREKSITFI